jgi:PST family polysaccharide transporter
LKALVHAAAYTALSTGVTLVVRVGRTKLVALTLGVTGVGFLSQVNTALEFATALVSIGLANAVVRGTAAAHTEGEAGRASTFLATSYLVALGLAAPLVLALFFAPPSLLENIFGQGMPPLTVVALAVAMPLLALTGMEQAVTQGLKSVRYLATATSATAVVGVVLLFPMVLLFGLNGALIHIALFSLAGYLLTLWVRLRASRDAKLKISLLAAPSLAAIGILLSYGSANAIGSIVRTANLLLVRTFIIDNFGIDQNGIYQVVWAMPGQVLSIVIGALSSYAFPVVSGLRDRDEITDAINTALRFTLLATTPLVAGVMLFRYPVIVALYSHDFLPAVTYLPFQLLGDFLKTITWALGLSLLGRGHLLAFTLLELGWNAIYTTGVFTLARFGLWCAVVSYVVGYLVHTSATYLYQFKREGFRLSRANTRLLASSSVLLVGEALVTVTGRGEYQALYTATGLLAWVSLGTLREERAAAWRGVRAGLRARRLFRVPGVT